MTYRLAEIERRTLGTLERDVTALEQFVTVPPVARERVDAQVEFAHALGLIDEEAYLSLSIRLSNLKIV